MIERLGVSEARPKLTHIMQEAYYKNTRFILERNGIPMAVALGVEECKELFEDIKDLKEMLEALKAPKEEWLDYDEYRIIYHVDDEQQLIRIGKVDRRREDTYKDIEDLFR